MRFGKYQFSAKRLLSLARSRLMLRKASAVPIPEITGEIRLFAMARNEDLRLPWFFDYYRSLGVDRFFFIDNGSTDGTLDIVRSQPDTHLFQTQESFKRYYYWNEVLFDRYGQGHWCLAVDIDECLTYPHQERFDLRALTRYLDEQGHGYLLSLLLDMYSDRPIHDVGYEPGEDPLARCPFFDTAYRSLDVTLWNPKSYSRYDIVRFTGNVRERAFGQSYHNLTKVPLFKYAADTYVAPGRHAIDGPVASDLQGTVLHFKYLQDFAPRAAIEAERKQHANEGFTYRSYDQVMRKSPDLCLRGPESVRYEGTEQLTALGLAKTSCAFERFVSERAC